MGPLLSSLVDLQLVETQLRQKRKKLKKGQQLIQAQEQRIKQHEGALQAKYEEIKLTRLQYGKLEMELKVREERITKLRVALNTARTNKDYSTILTQMNTDKAGKSKLEDQILTLMTQLDTDQLTCRDLEKSIEQEKARLAEVIGEVQSSQKLVQCELDLLIHKRQKVGSQVPAKELSMFERLADRFDGQVLAEVEQLNGRRGDHSCGGCYMSITLESVNALMTHDDVIACPNCGRILVLNLKANQQPA